MEVIPSGTCLTAYGGGKKDFLSTPLSELAGQIAEGKLEVQNGGVFGLGEIMRAHGVMEGNWARGKIVVLT